MAISENDRRDAYLSRIQVPALDVDGFATMLRRRAAFIAAVTAVCAALSLVWMLLSAPKYVASGQILLDLPAQAAVDAGKSASPEGAAASIDSRIGALTSRSVLDRVIAREKLDTDPLFGGKTKRILFTLLAGVGLVPAAEPHTVALRQLTHAISITRNPESNTVNVNVVTPDREMSARIANAVMDSYVEQRVGAETATGDIAPLGARLETLRTRLLDAEQRYEKYRSDSAAMTAAGGQSEKQVSDISEQIAAAEAKAGGLRSTLNQLQRARKTLDGGGMPDPVRGGAIGTFRSRYAAARELEIDLSETLGPRHPDRVIARMRAAEARRLLEQSIENVAQFVTADLERTRGVVTQLKNRLELSKQTLVKANEASAGLKELERDVEANRAAYQAVLVRSQQQRSDNASVRILSRATVPLESGRTFPVGALLISVLLGLGLGVSLAWLLELIDEQRRTAGSR